MNRANLQTLAQTRIREARILFEADEHSGAYYLAGYAVECALKAAIARQTEQHDFPDKQHALDSFDHDLNKLSKVAKLRKRLDADFAAAPKLEQNWLFVTGWSVNSRYNLYDEGTARSMLNAVADQANGVLPWITQFW